MNLEERLRGALKALEELNAPQYDVYRRSDEERLRGKIEGVKLALSYLNDEVCGDCPAQDGRSSEQKASDNARISEKGSQASTLLLK